MLTNNDGIDPVRSSIRMSTKRKQSRDELHLQLSSLFAVKDLDLKNISDVVVSSVVPEVDFAWRTLCIEVLEVDPIWVDGNLDSGITIELKDPNAVGADRIANCVAASKIVPKNKGAVVVDIGTATTWDLLSSEGVFLGGAIASGPMTSLNGLLGKSTKLVSIDKSLPTSAIGKSTDEALRSGLFYGYAGIVDRLAKKISDEFNYDVCFLATGGLASTICGYCEIPFEVKPELTMDGLLAIQRRIRGIA